MSQLNNGSTLDRLSAPSYNNETPFIELIEMPIG